ncbi:hypothetical protein [Leptolyngbya sp. FACHB-671]|uniref:hypothetical protein n=1 Tax=Leptolyngbya sp. FACHB-671 TaxID=2692812 RepID=UPI00168571F5|nr:hypothetical protein [Leptolyngbya sp. FACHB-671]
MCSSKKSQKKPHSLHFLSQKKTARSQRGIPETNYGELKKIASYSLTPTAVSLLKEISLDLEISASELLERFARVGAELKENLGQEVILEELVSKTVEPSNQP